MGFSYVKIFKTARVHNRRMSHTSITPRVSTSISSQNQIALTIFIMLVVFILCWTPYFVYVVYIAANHVTNHQTRDLALAAYWCVFLNSALNPFIYGIRNPHFGAAFKEMLVSATRSFSSLFGNVKNRGYSDTSTTITKPFQVSHSNSDVTPEESCYSNGSQTPISLRMCSSQIPVGDETPEKDVEKGRKVYEEHDFHDKTEVQFHRSIKTSLISHLNHGFEGKEKVISLAEHLCPDECSWSLGEQNSPTNNCNGLSLPRQQYVCRNMPHRSARRMLRPYTYPQTKPCIPLDNRTAFKMATRMRSRRRFTHAQRKSTVEINQTIDIQPRELNINSHVIVADVGTCQSQPTCKINPSKGKKKRRKIPWIETYM